MEQEYWEDHNYDEESGGHVSRGERLTIYVNKANKYLLSLISKESDEGKREIIRHRFKLGVGILTFAMYKRLVSDSEDNSDDQEEYDGDSAVRVASSAVAAHIVTLITNLGGDE